VNVVHNVNMIHTETTDVRPRRQTRREAKVDEILDAALDIAAADGVDGLTIQRLAKAMDWSAGALYRYYRGKDALLVAMQRRVLGSLGRRLQTARDSVPPDSTTTSLASILAVVDAFRDFATDDRLGFSLVTIFLGDPRVLLQDDEAEEVGEAMRPLLATTAAALMAAVTQGALTPGDTADRTLVLWASLHGILQLGKLERLEPRFSRTSTQLTDTLVDTLLLGWGADPGDLAAAHTGEAK
jgi:AcrR family transcriptional regulator